MFCMFIIHHRFTGIIANKFKLNDKTCRMFDRQNKNSLTLHRPIPRTFALCVGCLSMQFLVTLICVLLSKIKQLLKELCGDLTLAV